MDLLGGGSISDILRLSQFDSKIAMVIIGFMVAILFILIASSFFVLKEQAEQEELPINEYMNRFKVLRMGSALSDLILQFLFISKPSLFWERNLGSRTACIIYPGTLLFKTIFLISRKKQTMVLTGVCYLLGVSLFYMGVQSLLPCSTYF